MQTKLQDIICDECGSESIFVDVPEQIKEPKKKMTELGSVSVIPAVYKMTTVRCKDCGFTHSY